MLAEIESLAHLIVGQAYSDASKPAVRSAMRLWVTFEELFQDERPKMMREEQSLGGAAVSLEAALHNEMSLLYFGATLAEADYAPSTIETTMSLVKTQLNVIYGFALLPNAPVRLPRFLKAIRKRRKGSRKKRVGWRALHIRKLRGIIGPPKGFHPTLQDVVLCVASEGLLRSCEVAKAKGKAFDPGAQPTLEDLEFDTDEEGAQFARLWIYPAKQSKRVQKVPVLFPKGDGVTDGFSALKRYMTYRKGTTMPAEKQTPLFLFEDGEAINRNWIYNLVRSAAATIGLDPNGFGSHSCRIGGATDLLATGAQPTDIQVQGRWSSMMWQIYVTCCQQKVLSASKRSRMCVDRDFEEIYPTFTRSDVVSRLV